MKHELPYVPGYTPKHIPGENNPPHPAPAPQQPLEPLEPKS